MMDLFEMVTDFTILQLSPHIFFRRICPFIEIINPLYPSKLCVKFVWNLSRSSGEEDFKTYSFVIISPLRRGWPFRLKKMNLMLWA